MPSSSSYPVVNSPSSLLLLFLAASIGNFCVALAASNNQNDQRNAGDVRFGTAAAPAAIIGTERELLASSYRPRQRRALDMLEGDDFMGMQRKRALDLMEGDGFGGFEKRALDMMEGDDFMGLKKRSSNNKRALDILEGDDFIGMQRKRRSSSKGSNGLQRALARMNWQRQQQIRARRALDALEGSSFGF